LPIDQQVNGIQAAQAVNALWAITGNTDVPGGNIVIRNAFDQNVSYNYGFHLLPDEVRTERLGSEFPLLSKAGFSASAHADSVLQAIETAEPYPVRMVWMSSTNPIANMAADAPRVYKALRSVDFVVVNDLYLTPTAVAFADVFLPAAMSCERDSQRCWWTPARSMKKVTEFADVRSDENIVTDLGRRLHPENFPWTDEVGWNTNIIQTEMPGLPVSSLPEMQEKVYLYPEFNYRKHEKGLLRPDGQPGFNTPSGRVELYNTIFMLWGYDPLPYFEEPSCSPYSAPELYKEYPFVLTTGARSYEFFHSEHRQLETMREFHPWPLFEMHPDAADALGLADGDWCWIENQRGRCRQRLKANPTLDARVVRAEHGWWFPELEGAEPVLFGVFDSNINNLTPQCENGPTGFGAPYKNQLCTVYRCTPENSGDMPGTVVTRQGGFGQQGQ
ncbi:MAG: molybdopterin-dependent oxidoreductase, partial [Coriobacteriales bacterium]|nr:molybdopterin-dependent oxidoreductase [Coriobacteriales bacterium]